MEWLEPSGDLQAKILSRIEQARKRQLKFRLLVDYAACLFSFAVGASTSIGLWQAFSSTALRDFLALAWSDLPTVMAYWQEFSYSVLELLPATTMFVLALAVFSLALFLKNLAATKLELKRIRRGSLIRP